MRLVVSLMCLGLMTASGVAAAQQSPTVAPTTETAPPPTYPAEPPPLRPTHAFGPSETPAERVARYSRFSSGSGGLLLIFTELLSGMTTGGLLGHTLGTKNGTYLGGVIGGLTLGTGAALYQYYVPVERNESLLAASGAVLGFMAGFGAGSFHGGASDRAVAALITTQVGIIGVLAATSRPGDVSDGDAGLVGMTALYGLVVTGLIQATVAIADDGDNDLDLTPTLVAPLIGMGLGGLLAMPFELAPNRVLKLTVIPLGVGAVLLGTGFLLATGPAIPLSALGGITASFVITMLATANQPTPYPPTRSGPRYRSSRSDTVQAVPVPVLMRSGARGESLTAGPGVLMRF